MKHIEIRDCLYQYSVHQNRAHLPGLLMLHGFMGDHRAFSHVINELCTFCNPITIDLLGHGKTSKPKEPARYDEQEQVEDLLQFIKKLRLSPLYLYGYSMGGRLALKTALAEPGLFSGYIFESTNPGISDEINRKKRQETDRQKAQQIAHEFPEFLMKWQKLELFDSPLPVNQRLAEQYQQIQSEQSPGALSASLRGFGTGAMSPAWDELNDIRKPVLLLAGSNDEKYQRIHKKMTEHIPKSVFATVKAGHRVHVDNPTSFITEIRQYLNKNI